MPELRKDPITQRWVVISSEFRQPLPAFAGQGTTKAIPLCPFCPGHEHMTSAEIYAFRNVPDARTNGDGWSLRVIPNKFPILRVEGMLDSRAEGLYDKMNGIGANEVLIESPDHFQDFDALPPEQIELIFWAVRDRFLDLKKDSRIQYIQVLKNYGELAGALLEHPHMQMIGLPLVPAQIQEELAGFQQYLQVRGRCVFCDILRQETRHPERLVSENEHFFAFAPFASRFPFETWILPKQHFPDFITLGKSEARALSRILQDVLARIKKVLRDPAYNLILHTLPLQSRNPLDFHWHIEILPRLSRISGFELGTGYYLNPTPPEEAAGFLRSVGM